MMVSFAYFLRYIAVPIASGVASSTERSERYTVPTIAFAIP